MKIIATLVAALALVGVATAATPTEKILRAKMVAMEVHL